MAEQKRKLKGIADLYSIDDARDKSKSPAETIPTQTIPSETIPTTTVVNQTIPTQTIVNQAIPPQESINKNAPRKEFPIKESLIDINRGYYPVYNDLSDRLIPELKLKPHEQAILQRLYRLSRGWKSQECVVGLGALAKFCVMSKSQVQRSIATLINKGLVFDLGEEKRGGHEGKRYRVLPGLPSLPKQTIPTQTIVSETSTIVSENTVVSETIPTQTTNKYSNKDLKNTHSNTEDVRVGSKFTIEECHNYAKHLQSTGQGIHNPGGYATTIHRTGEADVLIENFLSAGTNSLAPNLDTSQCPDCQGTGMYYPEGLGKGGVKKCQHERLTRQI
jgi:hypothetical protein